MKIYIIPLIILGFVLLITPALATSLQGETSIQEMFPEPINGGVDLTRAENQSQIQVGWQHMPAQLDNSAESTYQLRTQQTPGMLGFWVSPMQPHCVTQVEPASDAFGYIFVGDIVLSMDNTDSHQYWSDGRNIGQPGTEVKVIFQHGRQVNVIYVRRKPIELFPEQMRAQLNWASFGR